MCSQKNFKRKREFPWNLGVLHVFVWVSSVDWFLNTFPQSLQDIWLSWTWIFTWSLRWSFWRPLVFPHILQDHTLSTFSIRSSRSYPVINLWLTVVVRVSVGVAFSLISVVSTVLANLGIFSLPISVSLWLKRVERLQSISSPWEEIWLYAFLFLLLSIDWEVG